MSESPGIDRVVSVCAALVAGALVLNGCSRFHNQLPASISYADREPTHRSLSPQRTSPAKSVTRLRDATEATKINDPKATTISNQGSKEVTKTDGARPVTRTDRADHATTEPIIDDAKTERVNADAQSESMIDDAEATTTIEDAELTPIDAAPIPATNGSQRSDFTQPPRRKLLPMKSLFNPNEKFMNETAEEARLRKIMRICVCQ